MNCRQRASGKDDGGGEKPGAKKKEKSKHGVLIQRNMGNEFLFFSFFFLSSGFPRLVQSWKRGGFFEGFLLVDTVDRMNSI